MKKRLLAFLLAVSIAVSMLVMPASAAGNNTAVQFAITLGAMDSEQSGALDAAVTRGAFARMLTSYSTYRESVSSQGAVGTLYTDLPGSSAWAPYVRIAVQQGWMNGYTDGSFRPNNAVTLEEACTAVLKLMGYKMTDLSGAFPNAQLNKAGELGLRAGLDRRQGEAMNYEDCAVLLYNALTANNASGSAYGTTLGFTVSNGQVDGSTILLSSLEGPFVASESTVLPFVPASVYRNDKVSGSAELNKYDVYYYSESLKTLWVYTRRAAGRITEVSPSASAPASITVAGTSYTLGSTAIASQVSSLNGGGVGQVVTLLLGMNNVAAGIITGEEADEVFYGVVQSASRNLIDEDNSADVLQTVKVLCTDGLAREVNVDKSLNFPTGWLVEVRVSPEGESVETIDERSVSGTVNENATALGDRALADDVQILDTSTGGVAGKGLGLRHLPSLHRPFLVLVLTLVGFGLVMLASASSAVALYRRGDAWAYLRPQLLYAALGLVGLWLASRVDYHIFHKLAWPLLALSLVLLVAVLFMPEYNGCKRWLVLPGLGTLQPSEIAKFAVVLVFSHVISLNHDQMKRFSVGVLPFALVLGVVAALMLLEPHLSGTLLILGIGAVLMFVGGTGLKWFVLAGVSGVAAIGAAVVIMPDLVPYAADRLNSWLDPFADPLGDGHQTIQSLYAIGSGGAAGLGLGNSRQKHLFVPEPQNDFIFSIVCEELGFVGACAVVGLFVLLLWRGITLAAHAPDRFGALLVVGFTVQVALQAVLNMAVVTNTIPNTGISLPFFSSGGTSLMMLLGEMGVVLSVSRGET